MDHTSTNNLNMNGSHMQTENNGSAYNGSNHNSFGDLIDYANLGSTPNNPGFDFEWDSNLFNANDETTASTTQQQPGVVSEPIQHYVRQSASPALPQYNPAPSNYQPNHYSQTSFEHRPMAHPTYDAPYLSRPSPSPGPYPGYSMPLGMNMPAREHAVQSPQLLNLQHGNLQPRPLSTGNPAMATPPVHSPYMQSAYNMQTPSYQNLNYFRGFPDQHTHSANGTVNPSVLTANNMAHMSGLRQDVMLQQFQARQQMNNSPYYTNAPIADPRTGQPSQTTAQFMPAKGVAQTGVLIPQQLKQVITPKPPIDPNAPKRQKGRPRKDGIVPQAKKDGQGSVSSYESDSESGLSVDDEPPDPKPAILVVAPPTDLGGKAMYDAVLAVWSPRNKPPNPEWINRGFGLFSEAVRALRDVWKAKNEALKKAENANNSEAAAELRKEVTRFRQIMDTTMQRSLQHGHDAHLERLGQNPLTMSALYSFLLDRFNAGDYDGTLVLSILRLVVKFRTTDEAMLEKTKVGKILEKLTKKAGPECKTLAQTILDNAAAATAKNKSAEQKLDSPASPRPPFDAAAKPRRSEPPVVMIPPRPGLVAGSKRPREPEPTGPQTVKKPITKLIPQASKPLAVQAAERKRAEAAAQAQAVKTEKLAANGVASAGPPKQKVTMIAPPKSASSIFSALQSASKRPGTTNADRAAAAKDIPTTAAKREPSPTRSALPNKPAFSFMEALSDMSKPKEVEPKKVEDLPPETDEERRKRLRKEARRQLRVSWKPDDSLVETKIFTHDPDEEVGHADSMMRDVDDIGGEGRMLKLHMDKEGLEDEDEDGEEFEFYASPSEVDLSELDADERSRNFIKMGGVHLPESVASQAQARHEENTLMVVYAIPEDVPHSPKEAPQSQDEDDYQPVPEFGDPDENTRAREAKVLAVRPRVQVPAVTPYVDINALLQAAKQAQPATQPPAILPDIQRTLSMLSQQQQFGQIQVQPPAQAQPQPAAGIDLSKLSAVASALSQLQGQQQPQFAPPAPQAVPQNLAALLATMSQSQQPQPQALPLGLQGNPNPFPGSDNDFSRKHLRNDSNGNDNESDGSRSKNKKKKGENRGDTNKPYNYKTQVCAFWQKGQCIKGDSCTYRHEDS